MKKNILSALLTLFSISLFAVPAKRFVKDAVLDNGETIKITRMGDEFGIYWIAENGKVVTFNGDGTCSFSDETPSQHRVKMLANNPRAQRRKTIGTPKALPKVLVVLVNYTDKAWTTANANNASNQLNQTGYNKNGNIGSVKEYFFDASNGAYNPEFDVYGPMNLAHNMSYYGGNQNGDDKNPQAMILEAAQYVYGLGVDLGDYDSDGDGAVDFFAVWYAGYSEAEDDGDYNWEGEWQANHPYLMWPHQWELSDPDAGVTIEQRTFGGTEVDSYFVFSELRGYINDGYGNRMSGIGTFCHEFSHALGLPDFYATQTNNSKTLKAWDLMDYGSYNGDGCIPPTYSAYERYFMRWLTPTVLNNPSNDTLSHILTANEAYMVSSDGTIKPVHASQAYYLLENRQQYKWDSELPGDGMMITKVTYNANNWTNNTPNDNVNNMGVDIMEAVTNSGSTAKATDLFPTSTKTSYTPYDGSKITEITRLSDGRVAFKFKGGAQDTSGDPSVTPDPPVSDDCFEDYISNPSGLGSETGIEIKTTSNQATFDQVFDNAGWTGEKVYVVAGSDGVRLGSSNYAGSLTTPALGIACNEMLVAFTFTEHDPNAIPTVSISGGGAITETTLESGGNSYLTIQNATAATKITFANTAKKKRFFFTSFEACSMDDPTGPTALKETQQIDVLVKAGGLEIGETDKAQVFSATGQMLYNGTGNRFLPLNAGLYIILTDKGAGKFIIR